MKKWTLTILISVILFIIIDVISAILAAERSILEGMFQSSFYILGIMIPILSGLYVGFKILEKEDKKSILWKMPLTTFIIVLIISIIAYAWILINIDTCEEFGCVMPLIWPIASIAYLIIFSVISFIIALVLYKTY